MPSSKGALVLFSGGQDSATCLAWALQRYARVETIGFDYGQRHAIELSVRPLLLQQMRSMSPSWDQQLDQDHVLDLRWLGQISDTALTQDTAIMMQANGLPNTFVPGRNLIFLTVAAILAYRRGLDVLVGGMCETDFSGYPDCRNNTLQALQTTLQLGMDSKLSIETPLMWLDKAKTWQLAAELGGKPLIELIRVHSHTCYLGQRDILHAWGYGCGQCPACLLRENGYQKFIEASPTPN